MKNIKRILAGTLIVSSLFSVGVFAETTDEVKTPTNVTEFSRGERGDRPERPELTEEQKAEREAIKVRVDALKEEGKTQEEIKAILESEGFERPDRPDRPERPELTEEQKAEREAVKVRVDALKEEGKTREEIKTILESEGFELPAKPDRGIKSGGFNRQNIED